MRLKYAHFSVAFSSFGAIAPPARMSLGNDPKSDFASDFTSGISDFKSGFASVASVVSGTTGGGSLDSLVTGNTCRTFSVLSPNDDIKDKTTKVAIAKMTTIDRCRAISGLWAWGNKTCLFWT